MMKILVFFAGSLVTMVSWGTCPVADVLIEKYGITFSGFSHAIPKVSEPAEINANKEDLVVIRLPNKKGDIPDGFLHSALINNKNKTAWIRRVGGFLSVYEWYGPIQVPKVDLAGCITEPYR